MSFLLKRLLGTLPSLAGEAGLPCMAERHLGLSHNFAFPAVAEETVSRLVRDVAAEDGNAAAVVCTNLRGTAGAPTLERYLGIAVLDSIAVALSGSLRLLSVDTSPLARWGRLFALRPAGVSA
jgi:maleate isomerase